MNVWCIWQLLSKILRLQPESCMLLGTSESCLLHRQENLHLLRQTLLRQTLHAMNIFSVAFVSFVLAAVLFAASSSVFIHRRHLMVWALFAPKWLFEVCMCFAGGSSVVFVCWVLGYISE